jgi:hypothetical protein
MTIIELPGDITPVEVVEAVIELHGDDIRFSSSQQKWLVFDQASGWTWDHENSWLPLLVTQTLRHLESMQPSESLTGIELRNFKKWRRRKCRGLMNNSGINGVISLASRSVELQVSNTSIDAASDVSVVQP